MKIKQRKRTIVTKKFA